MKNKKLLYSTLLMITVGSIAGGTFATKIHTTSENKNAVQHIQVTPSSVDKIADNSLSTPVEEPFFTVLKGVTFPDDATLRGAILNSTTKSSGQGSTAFSFKAPLDGKMQPVRFYIQNSGEKKLYVRLKSPIGKRWIETSIEPDMVFVGEMLWGLAQEGQWICDLNNDDGSIISAKVAFRTINS